MIDRQNQLFAAILFASLLANLGCASKSQEARLSPAQTQMAHGHENPLLKKDPFIRLGQEFEDTILKSFKSGIMKENEKALVEIFAEDYRAAAQNLWQVELNAEQSGNILVGKMIDPKPQAQEL